jgi:hypothetical protein
MKLFRDRYGNTFFAKNITELKRSTGIPGRVFPVFMDTKDGTTVQTGWGIGKHWFDVYSPMRKPV